MTNEELVLEYQRTGSGDVLSEICERNSGLVFMVVNDFRSVYEAESAGRAAVIESDDLKQDGFIGMIQAARNYEPDRGMSFSGVAVLYIRGAIMRALSDRGHVVRLPVYKRDQLNRLKKFKQSYIAEYGHKPRIDEISAFIGVSDEEVAELLKIEIRANVASLNQKLSDDQEEGELCDTVPDSRDYIAESDDRMCDAMIWAAVDDLNELQAAVIRGCYQEEKTLREIGEELNISGDKVAQEKGKALKQLRDGMHRHELQELAKWYDIAANVSYKGVGTGSFMRTRTSATERAALIRTEHAEQARSRIKAHDRMQAAGLTGREQEEYFRMLRREKKRVEDKRMYELLKGL